MSRLSCVFAGMCAALLLVGCDSDDGNSAESGNASGTWVIASIGDPGHGVEGSSMSLTQAGNSITGVMNSRGDTAPVLGNMQGRSVTLTASFPDGDVVHFAAVIHENQMTGTWVAGDGAGTFTATRT